MAAAAAPLDASAMVSAAVNEVLGGKLEGRKRTDCPRCVQGFERPGLLLNYSRIAKPELKECCCLAEHACPLSALVEEVLTQEKEKELVESTKLGVRKLKNLVADEVLKLVQSECGIGLLGTPTEKSAKSGGGRQQHRVRLYALVGGKIKSVGGQHNNVFMGLRGPDAAAGGAEGEEGTA